MAAFSATDVAFEGFRVTRERPLAVLAWAVLLVIANMITSALMISLAGPAFARLMAQQPGATPDPQQLVADLGSLLPAYLLVGAIGLLVGSVLYTAVNRAVLRPGEGGRTFLRFGADELRQLGLSLIYILLFMAVYTGAAVILGVLIGVGAGVAAGGGGSAVSGVVGLVVLLLAIAIACVFVFLAVRLSLASAETFDRRRLSVFGSWSLTRGRFWSLLGAYLLTLIMVLIIYLLFLAIAGGVAVAMGGGVEALAEMFRPNMTSVGGYFTPVMIAFQVLSGLLSALVLTLMTAAPASAYRQIAGTEPGAVFN